MEKDEGKEEVNKDLNQQDGLLLNNSTVDEENITNENDSRLIEQAFGESIEYEEISEIAASPINEPVKVGEVSDGFANKESTIQSKEQVVNETEEDLPDSMMADIEDEPKPTDAPEQIVNEGNDTHNNAEIPTTSSAIDSETEHAGLLADSFLGVADQMLEIGGGFFLKIKKKKSFYYFDELIERSPVKGFPKINDEIDEINKRNITRIKLDDSDKALLRPLLVQVLKNQSKQLTPEQQLLAVTISTAIKKGQQFLEARVENKLHAQNLEDRILKHIDRLEEMVKKTDQNQNNQSQGEEKERENETEKKAA